MRGAAPRTEPERGWAALSAHCSPSRLAGRPRVAAASVLLFGVQGEKSAGGNRPCAGRGQQGAYAERCRDADGRALATVLAACAAVGRTARARRPAQEDRGDGRTATRAAGSASSTSIARIA